MKQYEINDTCLELMLSLNALCNELVTDITKAESMGIKSHNFSKQDLKQLRIIHDNFCDVYNDIPNFENIAKYDEPIRAIND